MGRPRKVVPVERSTPDHEFDSNVLRFRRAVGNVLGEGIHVHLAAIKMRPSRLAELAVGSPKFAPLRWSDLDEPKKKALEALVPYRGADDLVMYGDTCVVTCPEAEWQAELRKKATLARKRMEQDLSVARTQRDVGMPIDDRWEEIDAASVPRPR